jgi:hypothetical protein
VSDVLLEALALPSLPCRDNDPGLWFADAARGRALAVELCRACPIVNACLDGAWARKERWGVWGAVDFEDVTRHALTRARRYATGEQQPRKPPKPCGTAAGASRHYARREKPCTPCRDALNDHRARRRQEAAQSA